MFDCRFCLPPEILEIIFGYLDGEEIINCSAVNSLWYEIARRILEKKNSMHLCRWPDTLPSNVRAACLAGDLSIKNFLGDEMKQVKNLKIWYDDPGLLPDRILQQVFSCCTEMKRLDLLNVATIEKHHIEDILELCRPGLRLRISFMDCDSSSYEVLNLLGEYQELFKEIVVEYRNSGSVFGWHPIYSSKSKFHLRHSAKLVLLTSPGLSLLECPQFCNVKSLKLEKCSSLNENVLLLLSKLNLEFFSIDSFSARESIWISSFKNGFSNLKSLSSTNNQVISEEVLNVLCDKNLQSVTLDFRKWSGTSSVRHLYKLVNLVYLKIFTNQIVTNELLEGINLYWSNMRTLEVEECSLGNDESIKTVETLKSYFASKQNIKFIHKINCTKFQENSILKTVDW